MTRFPTAPGRKLVNRAGDAVLETDFGTEEPRMFHLTDRTTGQQVSLDATQLAFLVREAKIPMSVEDDVLTRAAEEAFATANMVTGLEGTTRDFRTESIEWKAIARTAIAFALPVVAAPLPMDDRLLADLDASLGIENPDPRTRYNAAVDAAMNADLLANVLRTIAASGEGGTSGDGQADCIDRALNALTLYESTCVGQAGLRRTQAMSKLSASLERLKKPTGLGFEWNADDRTPEVRREMLRDLAELLRENAGRRMVLEGCGHLIHFDQALVMHDMVPYETGVGARYEAVFLTEDDAPTVEDMPEDVFAADRRITLERLDGTEIEFAIELDGITRTSKATKIPAGRDQRPSVVLRTAEGILTIAHAD